MGAAVRLRCFGQLLDDGLHLLVAATACCGELTSAPRRIRPAVAAGRVPVWGSVVPSAASAARRSASIGR